jgi:alkanesulfonate monooxygenase SsuD/methylene tetrahydromethanopterin reductase-like flavin-dependent oxidoreductase (luciferase family)
VLAQHCAAEGRDFASLRKTLSLRVFLDRSHQRAQELARERLKEGQAAIVGDPAAVREQLAELAALGFDYLILSFPRFQELDDLKLFVDAVQPAFS